MKANYFIYLVIKGLTPMFGYIFFYPNKEGISQTPDKNKKLFVFGSPEFPEEKLEEVLFVPGKSVAIKFLGGGKLEAFYNDKKDSFNYSGTFSEGEYKDRHVNASIIYLG